MSILHPLCQKRYTVHHRTTTLHDLWCPSSQNILQCLITKWQWKWDALLLRIPLSLAVFESSLEERVNSQRNVKKLKDKIGTNRDLRAWVSTGATGAWLILCNRWHPQFQIPNSSPVSTTDKGNVDKEFVLCHTEEFVLCYTLCRNKAVQALWFLHLTLPGHEDFSLYLTV